ncbi:hypothetical protein PIB30_016171 [Stylosanthes scabra]|uniref:Uncharacterized protein n=1 Tax=Stylosanthes scabra TaxID=79078 RepID=A0ABU6U7K3_9FABA|nr:hypothetical protein [Stylosanthes scabra]
MVRELLTCWTLRRCEQRADDGDGAATYGWTALRASVSDVQSARGVGERPRASFRRPYPNFRNGAAAAPLTAAATLSSPPLSVLLPLFLPNRVSMASFSTFARRRRLRFSLRIQGIDLCLQPHHRVYFSPLVSSAVAVPLVRRRLALLPRQRAACSATSTLFCLLIVRLQRRLRRCHFLLRRRSHPLLLLVATILSRF